MNIKQATEAIELTRRILNVVSNRNSHRFADALTKHDAEPRDANATYTQGFRDGMNLVAKALSNDVDDLDLAALLAAIQTPDQEPQ